MKKALTRTIIVCVAVNLMTTGFVLAQNAAEEKTQGSNRKGNDAGEKRSGPYTKEEIEAKVAQYVAQKEAEATQKQMEVAQKEMETQLKQLLTAQTQIELQIPNLEVAAPRIPRIPLLGHSSSGAVLVIPATQMKTEDLAAITEDMAVMSRIFDKKLSQAQLITGGSLFVGIDPMLSFGRSSGAIEAIYLEGYGALFLMKVNALLSPLPEALEEKETKEEDIDPLWAETRRRMYEPEEVSRRRRGDRLEEKYDAEKVEELKETLIKTLKHAANIRSFKPDESVILTVIGKAGQSGTRTTTRSYGLSSMGSSTGRRGRSSMVRGAPGSMVRGAPGVPTVAASLLPTVLTIRAKKSDIDAFAKGQLSFDQFTQKTLLLSYSYLGGNIGGGPSRSSLTDIDMLLRKVDSDSRRSRR